MAQVFKRNLRAARPIGAFHFCKSNIRKKTAPINRTTPQHRVRTFKTGRPISSMIDDKESVIALKPMLSEY